MSANLRTTETTITIKEFKGSYPMTFSRFEKSLFFSRKVDAPFKRVCSFIESIGYSLISLPVENLNGDTIGYKLMVRIEGVEIFKSSAIFDLKTAKKLLAVKALNYEEFGEINC